MKISSAEFVTSAFDRRHWVTDGRPEVAFLGRSNVGKSSLINSLLLRKSLARTSNTPGRTQSINFFLINGSFYFVDLPGYGFARVSKGVRADWREMAEEYLAGRDNLVLCIQLIDARRPPTALDVQLNEWLRHVGKPCIAVATKADKLSCSELGKTVRAIGRAMPETRVVPHSARTGCGRETAWHEIAAALEKSRFFC